MITEQLANSMPMNTAAVRETAAERMRRCRARRRAGYRCLTIEIHDTEIDGLIRCGLLPVKDRDDPDAILAAIYEHLEHSIGRLT